MEEDPSETNMETNPDPFDPLLTRIEEVLDEIDAETRTVDDKERISIYLAIFEGMMNLVYEHEDHLLSGEEWDLIAKFGHLTYNARFVLVRLALRKPGRWYAMAKLETLKKEVGTGLADALDELCIANTTLAPIPTTQVKSAHPEPEIIDLTLDSDDELNPSTSSTLTPAPTLPDYSYFCQSENEMTLPELLDCLTVDQLKSVAKDMKVRVGKQTKSEVIDALLKYASKQTALPFNPSPIKSKAQDTLHFPVVSRAKIVKQPLRQSTLLFKPAPNKRAPLHTQEHVLRNLALKHLVKCIRLNPDIYELFMRLNVIAFRSTEMPNSIALPALLTAFKKRSYTRYPYQRSSHIWSSREEFLRYYAALKLHSRVSALLDSPPPASDRKSTTPTTKEARTSPTKTPSAPPTSTQPLPRNQDDDSDYEEDLPPPDSVRLQRARRCKELLDEEIYPVWTASVKIYRAKGKAESGHAPENPGLERFEPGYLYTQMVSRATECLGQLKEYACEYSVIEALLDQRIWLRGKRAKWYERRAILTTRYMWQTLEDLTKTKALANAMQGVVEALKDEETALVFRPSLFRRLERLEKQLKIPEDQRSKCDGRLRKPGQIQLEAIRVWTRGSGKLTFDANGHLIPQDEAKDKEKPDMIPVTPAKKVQMTLHDSPFSRSTLASPAGGLPSGQSPSKGSQVRWTGKSVWLGRGAEEVNVETRALQYYERQGFKGMHSETSILTTLFALLFWDIIFADIAGAFETPYQTEPLDLREDVFYYARKAAIDVRLKEIRGGWAKAIIEKHDSKYREQKTWCVGMSWDLCGASDLIEISECLGGDALARICHLFCEDYNGRSSGVPDLILWNPDTKDCKFVEVKGPGDTERENQKLWMDALLNAGVGVEVCRVYDGKPPTKGKGKGTPRSASRSSKKSKTKNTSAPSSHVPPASVSLSTTAAKRRSKATNNRISPDVGWDDDDDVLPVPSPSRSPPALPQKRRYDEAETGTTTPSTHKKLKVSFP